MSPLGSRGGGGGDRVEAGEARVSPLGSRGARVSPLGSRGARVSPLGSRGG